MPDLMTSEIKEKAAEKGVPPIIKKKEFDKICDDNYDKIMRVMMESPDYVSVIYADKNKIKFDENGKKIRNNRDEKGKRKKYVRKDKASQFWNK